MQRPAGNPGIAAKLEQERQLKAGVSSHKTGLPPKLLELFKPLPPLEPKAPPQKRKPKSPYTGIAQYVEKFAAPGDAEYEPQPAEPLPPDEERRFRNPEMILQARVEKPLKLEKDTKIRERKQKEAAEATERSLKRWDPSKDPHIEGDPFKTLFVGRLSYDVTDKRLRREFEEYGPVKNVTIVHDSKTGKPRGYAFIEFEHKNDMKTAYKMADGRKVENKRVTVDVERGRTVPNWLPRRLGGGKGGESREPKEPKDPNQRAKKGLPQLDRAGGLGLGLSARAPPPREERRPEPRAREEERRPEPRARDAMPPPPAAAQQWPVSSGAEDRDRERERARERDRERDRPARAERDRSDREYVDRARSDREKERERDRGARSSEGSKRERSRDRDRGGDRDRGREHDREPRSERKRDRHDREAGEVDDRSSKRHREERSSSRRRERDL